MEFTPAVLEAALAEMKRQAAVKGHPDHIDGVNWIPLEEIAGPRAYRTFFALMNAGKLREEVLRGCFGHAVYHFV